MTARQILKFLHEVEKLKHELRHSWLSNGRRESVAEHAWRVSLMAILIAPNLSKKINLTKALKMSVIHDLNEAYVGDVPAFSQKHSLQKTDETKSIKKLIKRFPKQVMYEIHDLWHEFEEQKTIESKFIKALDKIEVRIQHNEADLSTWKDIEYPRSLFSADKYCEFDEFVKEFNEAIKNESRRKMKNSSDVNINEIEKQAEQMKGS